MQFALGDIGGIVVKTCPIPSSTGICDHPNQIQLALQHRALHTEPQLACAERQWYGCFRLLFGMRYMRRDPYATGYFAALGILQRLKDKRLAIAREHHT